MNHQFDIEIATQYGILEAVLLNNFWFWIRKNEENDFNFHDGKYWTFNSIKAFHGLFPYATEKQIRSALEHLKAEELIETANYNNDKFNRSLWYTLTEKGRLAVDGKCICPTGQIESPNGANDYIYINNNNHKTDIKTTDINNIYSSEFEELWKKYPRKKGKKRAYLHYKNARRDGTTFEEVSKGLDNYLEYLDKEVVEEQYIKYGSSWFCGENWEDEYTTNLPQQETAEEKAKRLAKEWGLDE